MHEFAGLLPGGDLGHVDMRMPQQQAQQLATHVTGTSRDTGL